MEKKEELRGHVLAIPYPSQGHINPLLQFYRHLSVTRPIKTTFVLTTFISTTFPPKPISGVGIDTFSDGHDVNGFTDSDTVESYIAHMEAVGRRSVSDLIRRHSASNDHPFTCVIYDSFLTWALEVTKDHGLVAAAFFTQPCTVNKLHIQRFEPWFMGPRWRDDVPVRGPWGGADARGHAELLGGAAYVEAVLNQHSNLDKADCVLFNTFYDLENQV